MIKASVLLQRLTSPVRFSYVQAYRGILGYQNADQLAKQGALPPSIETLELLLGFEHIANVGLGAAIDVSRFSSTSAHTASDSESMKHPKYTALYVAAGTILSEMTGTILSEMKLITSIQVSGTLTW